MLGQALGVTGLFVGSGLGCLFWGEGWRGDERVSGVRCFGLGGHLGNINHDAAGGIHTQPLACADVGELDGFAVVAAPAAALPRHGVMAIGDVGVGAVLDGGEGDCAGSSRVGAAVCIGGGGIASGGEGYAALRVQRAGLNQGIAARVGADVSCAGEAGDLIGLVLAFVLVVYPACCRIVGCPVCLDGDSVGGQGFGVGAATAVHGGQQFEVASGIEVDAASACRELRGLQHDVVAASDFDAVALCGAAEGIKAVAGITDGAALLGEEVGVGDSYGAAALVEGVLARKQGYGAACHQRQIACLGGKVGATGDEVAAIAGEAAAGVALLATVGARFVMRVRQPCQ